MWHIGDYILFFIISVFFAFIPATIIYLVNDHFNEKNDNKYLLEISSFVISILIFIFFIIDHTDEMRIKNIVDSAKSVKEVQEDIYYYYDGDDE